MHQTSGHFVAERRPPGPGSDNPETDALRLVSDGGARGPSLAERLGERLDRLSFASPWHRLRLKGRYPLKLLAVPEDPVPGDAHAAAAIREGRLAKAGHAPALANVRLDDAAAPNAWREWVHGWGWLRDMAGAAPAPADFKRAEGLARRWLHHFHHYEPAAWAPAATGRRIMMAIAHAPLVMPGHDHIHRSAVLSGIARWARHLDRAAPRVPDGLGRAEAAAGLLAAALLLPGGDERRARAEALMVETLGRLVHADGSAAARSPLELARTADLLLCCGAFYDARAQARPDWLVGTLDRIRNALAGLAMGDGVPAPWHGGQPTAAAMARLGALGAATAPGRLSGFQRLAAGRTVVIVDAGPPPPARLNPAAHASTLALAISDGDRLLVTSCGAEQGAGPEGERRLPQALAEGLRSSAAHSTLVVADTNSSRLVDGGPRRPGGVREVVVETRFSGDGQWLEARHDGYRRRFGFDHLRRLYLSPDGEDFRGEDQLLPVGGVLARFGAAGALPVVIRFHLGPDCRATGTGDGHGALIRMGAGRDQSAWSFRAVFTTAPGTLGIEPGLVIDAAGQSHEVQVLSLATTAAAGSAASVGWSFRRQGR